MTSTPFSEIKKSLPMLGVGLGLRRSLLKDTLAHREQIDWLEIVPENHMGKGGRSLSIIKEVMEAGFPLISHGVNLSIGSAEGFDENYLRDLQQLFALVRPAWFSDHLTFSRAGGVYLNDLFPLPHTRETVEFVVKQIKALQSRFEMPFLIENASIYSRFGHDELTEAQFLSEVLEGADCGLMLDVNNVYVNAQNHGYDAMDFLHRIPLERVTQIHIAGHLRLKHMIVDTHGSGVCPEVYDILRSVLAQTTVHGILLERDQNYPDFSELLDELAEIRRIQKKASAVSGGV